MRVAGDTDDPGGGRWRAVGWLMVVEAVPSEMVLYLPLVCNTVLNRIWSQGWMQRISVLLLSQLQR